MTHTRVQFLQNMPKKEHTHIVWNYVRLIQLLPKVNVLKLPQLNQHHFRFGETELSVPRDRNVESEPKIIRKYETTSNQLEEQIIAMYAKGMSTRDIEDHMRDIYGQLRKVTKTKTTYPTDESLIKIIYLATVEA